MATDIASLAGKGVNNLAAKLGEAGWTSVAKDIDTTTKAVSKAVDYIKDSPVTEAIGKELEKVWDGVNNLASSIKKNGIIGTTDAGFQKVEQEIQDIKATLNDKDKMSKLTEQAKNELADRLFQAYQFLEKTTRGARGAISDRFGAAIDALHNEAENIRSTGKETTFTEDLVSAASFLAKKGGKGLNLGADQVKKLFGGKDWSKLSKADFAKAAQDIKDGFNDGYKQIKRDIKAIRDNPTRAVQDIAERLEKSGLADKVKEYVEVLREWTNSKVNENKSSVEGAEEVAKNKGVFDTIVDWVKAKLDSEENKGEEGKQDTPEGKRSTSENKRDEDVIDAESGDIIEVEAASQNETDDRKTESRRSGNTESKKSQNDDLTSEDFEDILEESRKKDKSEGVDSGEGNRNDTTKLGNTGGTGGIRRVSNKYVVSSSAVGGQHQSNVSRTLAWHEENVRKLHRGLRGNKNVSKDIDPNIANLAPLFTQCVKELRELITRTSPDEQLKKDLAGYIVLLEEIPRSKSKEYGKYLQAVAQILKLDLNAVYMGIVNTLAQAPNKLKIGSINDALTLIANLTRIEVPSSFHGDMEKFSQGLDVVFGEITSRLEQDIKGLKELEAIAPSSPYPTKFSLQFTLSRGGFYYLNPQHGAIGIYVGKSPYAANNISYQESYIHESTHLRTESIIAVGGVPLYNRPDANQLRNEINELAQNVKGYFKEEDLFSDEDISNPDAAAAAKEQLNYIFDQAHEFIVYSRTHASIRDKLKTITVNGKNAYEEATRLTIEAAKLTETIWQKLAIQNTSAQTPSTVSSAIGSTFSNFSELEDSEPTPKVKTWHKAINNRLKGFLDGSIVHRTPINNLEIPNEVRERLKAVYDLLTGVPKEVRKSFVTNVQRAITTLPDILDITSNLPDQQAREKEYGQDIDRNNPETFKNTAKSRHILPIENPARGLLFTNADEMIKDGVKGKVDPNVAVAFIKGVYGYLLRHRFANMDETEWESFLEDIPELSFNDLSSEAIETARAKFHSMGKFRSSAADEIGGEGPSERRI
ncbi:MAG: hypothetical protein LBI57_07835 [Helicobacteraceae bacterium]|jgi:hypothetical protein|nr:hypothetical protein [Helicobacteraceae bacterium]